MRKFKLPFAVKKPILACGADLKGAFAFAKGDEAIIADGFGDLANPDNLARYEKAAKRYAAKAEIIACDLHPGYFSTRFAESLKLKAYSLQLCKIQHHEAHVVSAIVDNAVKGDVIGVAFDGTGFGLDKNIWGGEFFVGNPGNLKRAGHFEYVPMPGGEVAIREPWRMAVSYLYYAFGNKFLALKIDFLKKFRKRCQAPLIKIIEKGVNSPLTSSAGRLFDGVASLVMAKDTASYEAELPIELQKLAFELCQDAYDFDIRTEKGMFVIGVAKIIKGVVKDLAGKSMNLYDNSTTRLRY